jgi:hypothetical protein
MKSTTFEHEWTYEVYQSCILMYFTSSLMTISTFQRIL